MDRRAFIKTAGVISSFGLSPSVFSSDTPNAADDRPNIIIILVDDLGYGDLSSFGAADIRTPNIDALMAAGMRFNNFYANSPVCSPTRAALLTGCYPDRVGVPGVIRVNRKFNWGCLDKNAVLLPQVLKKRGYHSAGIGKWHLGLESPDTPNERGFDFFHGFLEGMVDDYYTHDREGFNFMRRNDQPITPKGHTTDLYTQWAIEYIRQQAQAQTPFFLYLAYNAPHVPIQPPKEWLDRIRNREKTISEKRAKLAALIEHLDEGIGQVVNAVRTSGVEKKTLIIFASDNGGQLDAAASSGVLNGGKEDMYEGGIKVPMCAAWPGSIKPQTISTTVNLTMDIFPTVCQAAGVTWDHPIDGRSFLPELLGRREQQAQERYLFWVRREGNQYGGRDYYAARYGDWKLLQNTPFKPMRLYNLKEDPIEKTPLDNAHPMYKQLFESLRNHINDVGIAPWQRPQH